MTAPELTLDGFLGGRLTLAQPKAGFRAGHDTVLLAAAVPAGPGNLVLELGAGAGVASLCLGARVPGVLVKGIEIDPVLVQLANANAARNGMAERVQFAEGDVAALGLGAAGFDHVFFNPPFHPPTGQGSPEPSRRRAMADGGHAPVLWTVAALACVAPLGSVSAIVRWDRAEEIIAAAADNGAVLFPLFPRDGETPKRALVQIVKNGRKSLRRVQGLVLHRREGGNTAEAEAILRGGQALSLD